MEWRSGAGYRVEVELADKNEHVRSLNLAALGTETGNLIPACQINKTQPARAAPHRSFSHTWDQTCK